MSDELFTNIDDLDALVQQCEAAGQRILQNSNDFQGDMRTAISEFHSTMNTLRTQVQEFETEMNGDIDRLISDAQSVHWDGTAKQGFDADIAAFQTAVKMSCSDLRSGIDMTVNEVNTRFTGSLDEAAVQNQRASQAIDESTMKLSQESANTRAGVEAVDASWSSAL